MRDSRIIRVITDAMLIIITPVDIASTIPATRSYDPMPVMSESDQNIGMNIH